MHVGLKLFCADFSLRCSLQEFPCDWCSPNVGHTLLVIGLFAATDVTDKYPGQKILISKPGKKNPPLQCCNIIVGIPPWVDTTVIIIYDWLCYVVMLSVSLPPKQLSGNGLKPTKKTHVMVLTTLIPRLAFKVLHVSLSL